MRILILNYEFPPVGGGGGRASADLGRALARRGHELRILTSSAPGLPRSSSFDGLDVIRLFTGRRSRTRASLPVMLAYVVAAGAAGIAHVRSWKPDVLHAHFAVPTGLAAWAIHRVVRVPYLLTVHLGDVPGGVPEKTGGWFRWVQPWTPPIWKAAARVVAVSEHTRRLARQAYDVPIEVIPNGVDLERWEPRLLQVARPPRLIFAGRFQPQKNVVGLVESLARLRDLEWSCALVGDGPQRRQVEGAIRERGLSGRIELPGWLDSAEVDRRLMESDVLVLPSRSEGLPVVGVQALAAGLAIVGTRAGGLAELIEDGVNGRISDPADLDAFTQGLRWCLEDQDRLLGLRRASLRKAAAYDLRSTADAYERLFAEIIAGP